MKKLLKKQLSVLALGTSLLIPFSVSAASVNANNNSATKSSISTVQKSDSSNLDVHPNYMEKGTVTGNAVNLRSKPNTSSTILRQLNKGDVVWLEGFSGSWLHVVYYSPNGAIEGWIYKQYVSY